MWYIYTLEYYSAIKKEWDNSIYSNMDATRDTVLSEVKSEGESTMWYIYMWNLKYDTNKYIYETEIDSGT